MQRTIETSDGISLDKDSFGRLALRYTRPSSADETSPSHLHSYGIGTNALCLSMWEDLREPAQTDTNTCLGFAFLVQLPSSNTSAFKAHLAIKLETGSTFEGYYPCDKTESKSVFLTVLSIVFVG